MISDSGACAIVCENEEQLAKIVEIRDQVPEPAHRDRDRPPRRVRRQRLRPAELPLGAITLEEVRGAARAARRRSSRPVAPAVRPRGRRSRSSTPPARPARRRAACSRHGNYRAIIDMVGEAGEIQRGRGHLPVPAARALLRAADPARRRSTSAARSPTSAGTPSRSSPSCWRSNPPTCRRCRACSRRSTRSPTARSQAMAPEERKRAEDAIALGVKVRDMMSRGEARARGAAEGLRRGRRAAVQERPRDLRRARAPRHQRRRPDRQGDPRILLGLRRARAGGLRHDRDGHRRDHLDGRQPPLRHRRPRAARASS